MTSLSNNAPAVFVCTPIMYERGGKLLPAMQDARRDNAHLGVYLLLGHLRRAGCDCDVLDWVAEAPELTTEDAALIVSQYEVAFFSCNSLNWATVRLLVMRARELNPAIKICIGGPHPTLYPDAVAASGLFDAYYRGEADRYIHLIYGALLSGRAPQCVPGLWMPSVGATKRPEIVQEIHLTHLDWRPDYYRIPQKKYLAIPVQTSRGCKHACTFCSISAKKNWRSYPVHSATEQLLYANQYIEHAHHKIISIIDDTFTTDHQRVIELCNTLPRSEFQERLMYDATLVDLQDRELVEALKPFTSALLVGAEVSTKADAKRIRKAATPEIIRRAARNLQAVDLSGRAVFSFIMGFPWQTVEDCLHTVGFVTNLILDYGIRVYLQWYWPMPGSDIWKMLEAEERVHISIADTAGFYRSTDWFYSTREINSADVHRIDERVRPVQLCLMLHNGNVASRRPLEYSRPDLDDSGEDWEARRNPFLEREPDCKSAMLQ